MQPAVTSSLMRFIIYSGWILAEGILSGMKVKLIGCELPMGEPEERLWIRLGYDFIRFLLVRAWFHCSQYILSHKLCTGSWINQFLVHLMAVCLGPCRENRCACHCKGCSCCCRIHRHCTWHRPAFPVFYWYEFVVLLACNKGVWGFAQIGHDTWSCPMPKSLKTQELSHIVLKRSVYLACHKGCSDKKYCKQGY